ncbi:hypothetical protein ILP92_14325 [Maribius pontilimi]|uniref:Uncharacterized protein n=2 Tax=Palleronia pontilimi TaxID=1964209 RepID=A0A934IJX4_9RHOB|nr:hypothetical protein [Palleronia pontilimi]
MVLRPAHARSNCAPRDLVLEKLASEFSESRQSIGLAANNQVVETFAAPSGSWTVIVTAPSGISCIVASGQSFELTADALPPQGDPA